MSEKIDKSIQVDDIDDKEMEEYITKRKNLEGLTQRMQELINSVDTMVKENDEEIKNINEIKKAKMERQLYKQKNVNLREETEYMKTYIRLKEEKDDLELQIQEQHLRHELRKLSLLSRYGIPQKQASEQTLVSVPPQTQTAIQAHVSVPPLETVQTSDSLPSLPPPPPPPPPPQPSIQNIKGAPPASHPPIKPTNINDELRQALSEKFKNFGISN